jgi:hypothetical protein
LVRIIFFLKGSQLKVSTNAKFLLLIVSGGGG